MSASQIRTALGSAPDWDKAFVFKQQADRFEEELLGVSRVPEDYLQLFVDVVSESSLACQPGAWNFIVRM